MLSARSRVAALVAGLLASLAAPLAVAHGGVLAEADRCIIRIGVYTAHFTIYQPETRASKEYCEDIPDVTRTIFVMDYLHDSLRQVPVDFRIIRDVLDRRTYASVADVRKIDDLDAATVFYQAPRVEPQGSLTVEHTFTRPGWYIGIVTARHPTLDKTYEAVFGFHVGKRSWGFWPWVILGLLAVQLQYWVASGGLARWRKSRRAAGKADS